MQWRALHDGALQLQKEQFGADVGYRFNPENRVVAGFDYLDADRERIDFIHNIDRKYSLEWKNSAFDTLDTKANSST